MKKGLEKIIKIMKDFITDFFQSWITIRMNCEVNHMYEKIIHRE